MSDDHDDAWHLDKRVPLALIFTILAQTAAGFWWASNTSTRLEAVERRVEQSAPQGDRLTRVEVKVDGVQRTLDKIEAALQRQSETPSRPRNEQP